MVLALLAMQSAIATSASTVDPRTNSWFTTYSGKYARVYTNDAMKSAGNTISNWSNGTLSQSTPAYCGIQEVYASMNWVYVRSTGLAGYIMGPWYLNAARTSMFPNLPVNQKLLYRFPRTNGVPTSKTLTGGGQIGIFVDGVEMFNSWDAYYWNGSTETSGAGTGYWNRDAYVNEGVTFDAGYAHQQNTGTYHYHANPIGLRYLLGDHVDYNSTTKAYSESTNTPTKHSPILGWVGDGFPVYGPYGYSNATNANSGVRRMISGYVLRNGSDGTSNLTANGRTTIPQWAVRAFNVSSNQSGPNVSTTYPLGRYMEDNDYLGDHGYVQGVDFDLDEYNGRWCVTPEFPNGTYAYFVAITSNGAPSFPYNIGRAFYGSAVGGSVSSISETVTTNFLGNTNIASTLSSPTVKNGTVTLTWSAIEGGSYQLESSTNLSTWTTVATGITASPNQVTASYTNATAQDKGFYREARTSVTTFDSPGTTTFAISAVAPGGSASRGQTVLLTITLTAPPNLPPAGAPISYVTVGSLTASNATCTVSGTVQALLTIPSGYMPTGAQNVTVQFNPNPSYTLTGGFTIN